MKQSLSHDDEKRIENKLKALDLELTYGAHTHISGDAPPEIVSQWLDNVRRYEEQYAKARKIPVSTFIGQPEIRSADSLKEEEYEPEIKKVLQLLEEKSVVIDRPEFLSPERYYRFLTEEFLSHLLTDYSAPGMIHCFSYSEFHHDGPEFIAGHVSEFLLDLMDLGKVFEGVWLSEHCRDDHLPISRAEVHKRVGSFRALYKEIEPLWFRAQRAEVFDSAMYLLFAVAWNGIPANGREKEHHKGPGICQLELSEGEWLIQGIRFPGFCF